MLAYLFYLSAIWLILALIMAVLLATRIPHTDPVTSFLYLALLVAIGAEVALLWLREPFELVVITSAVILACGLPVILLLRDWNAPGQAFFLFSLSTSIIYLFYAFMVTAFSAMSPVAFLISCLLFFLELAALTLSLTYAFEVLDALCRVRWRRIAARKSLGAYTPMVSLHVPAYNEPPELVERTLRSLATLNYPFFEVILVDNNTPDEATWKPLEVVCRELGFKCLHLDRWPGYKSGALNFALAMTDPRAEIIAVIDADYVVDPDYLRNLVPYFEDPRIAFVQTPQDYRNYKGNRFYQAAYDGYKYFFALSMPFRNERNAIIFCGTMGLLRKQVLQEIGGWDEWCITEDAEASLRILNRGYQSLYVEEAYGRGLMPLDFEGLKKQRFRWTFGGVQILKKHWGKLMPWARWVDPNNRLTPVQRYLYFAAGLQWFNELLTFAFTIMVVISALLTIVGQTAILRPVSQAFVILPIVLIGTNLIRALWGLRHALHLTWKRAFYALTLWFSLTWVVALACVQALIQKRGIFLRTPKSMTNLRWVRAIQASSLEMLVGAICVLGGLGAMIVAPSVLTAGLMVLCFSQAVIYLSAPSHSLISLESAPRSMPARSDRGDIYGTYANESRLGLQIAGIAMVLLALTFVAALWPAPSGLPWWYSYFDPEPLVIPEALPTPTPLPLIPPAASPTAPPAATPTSPPPPSSTAPPPPSEPPPPTP